MKKIKGNFKFWLSEVANNALELLVVGIISLACGMILWAIIFQ